MPIVDPNTISLSVKDFQNWTPAVDARRLGKPTIIGGRNFKFGIDGPYSAYANSLSNWAQLDAFWRARVQNLDLDTELWYGTPKGVFRVRTISRDIEPMIVPTITNTYWPWSVAKVGGKFYFCQYNIGLWQYDPATNTIKKLVTTAGDNIRGLCNSFGRLVVLGDTFVAWSNLDDGSIFSPSIQTGAGAQTLNILSTNAYRVDAVADGVIISTDKGLIKGTFVTANYVFQWSVLSRGVKIFSPNAAVYIPETGLVLVDAGGFHLTDGGKPTAWNEVFGEYLKTAYISGLDRTKIGTMNLVYSLASQTLFVSFSPNAREGQFTSSFGYYIPSDDWGVLSYAHYGIFEQIIQPNNAYTTSFVGLDGYMRHFTLQLYTETQPLAPYSISNFLWRTSDVAAPRTYNTAGTNVTVFYADIVTSDVIPTAYNSVAAISGLYQILDEPLSDSVVPTGDDPAPIVTDDLIVVGTYLNFDPTGMVPIVAVGYSLPQIGLDSFIDLGPFRYIQQHAADETSSISSLMLGNTASANFIIVEDWLTDVEAVVDWLLGDTDTSEDWGSGFAIANDYDVDLMATDDANNPQIQGTERLEATAQLGAAKLYAPLGYSAMYHRFRVAANDPGQGYAIKTIDIAGTVTGRSLAFGG